MVWGQNKNQRSYGGGGSSSMGTYQGGGGRGILGESPGGGMASGGGYAGIQGLGGIGQSIIGNIGNDNIDTMMQQRRLQQQLSLRESQLALASNLLQKQSQLIMDVGLPGSGGGGSMGPMLQSPNPMSRQMIPSLLDMPSNPRQGKRPGQMGRDMDFKRRRRDSSPSDQRGRHSDFDRRPRDRDRFSPVRRREDPPSRRDRPSRFSRRDSGEGRRRRRSSEEYDPANPTADGEEMPDLELADEVVGDGRQNFRSHMTSTRHRERMSEVLDVGDKGPQSQARMKAQEHLKRIERTGVGFCKLCDQDLSIPFMRHKLTTLHKKREMQVHKGCGWCGVKNFLNFSQVLKHREKESHKQNAAKFGKRATEDRDRRDSRESRERRTESRTSSNRSRDMVTVDSVGFERDSSRRNRSSSRTSKTSPKESDPMPELKFDAEVAVGQNYVIPVSGFFCKLCHKFYNTENAAKVTHCQSEPHFNLFKKAKIAAKAKAKALEEKAKPTSTSTPISDNTKPSETEDADNTMAEMRKEEQMDEDKKAAEGEENAEVKKEENEGEEKAEDNKDREEAKEDEESPEADHDEAMDVGDVEELRHTEEEEQEASVVEREGEAANGVAEEEEDPLTEEQEEEKLLQKNDNEDDFPEEDLALDDDECDDSVGIVDLAEDSAMKEETADDSKTEAECGEEESGEPPAEPEPEAEPEAEDTEVVEVQPVAARGRGRARARRGKRGKK